MATNPQIVGPLRVQMLAGWRADWLVGSSKIHVNLENCNKIFSFDKTKLPRILYRKKKNKKTIKDEVRLKLRQRRKKYNTTRACKCRCPLNSPTGVVTIQNHFVFVVLDNNNKKLSSTLLLVVVAKIEWQWHGDYSDVGVATQCGGAMSWFALETGINTASPYASCLCKQRRKQISQNSSSPHFQLVASEKKAMRTHIINGDTNNGHRTVRPQHPMVHSGRRCCCDYWPIDIAFKINESIKKMNTSPPLC